MCETEKQEKLFSMDINRIFSKNNFSNHEHRELVDKERSISVSGCPHSRESTRERGERKPIFKVYIRSLPDGGNSVAAFA